MFFAKNAAVNMQNKISIQDDLVADVSFISYGALRHPENEHICISGNALLKVILNSTKNDKQFIYDGTHNPLSTLAAIDDSKPLFNDKDTSDAMLLMNIANEHEDTFSTMSTLLDDRKPLGLEQADIRTFEF